MISELLKIPPVTDWRLVILSGFPTLGMYSHMLSPTRNVLLPFSLAGERKTEAIWSLPFFTENMINSFLVPSGSTFISFLYIWKLSGFRFRSTFLRISLPSKANAVIEENVMSRAIISFIFIIFISIKVLS